MHLRFLTNVPLLLLLASVAAFAQKPELVLQTGHSSMVSTVRFSPDGRFLASSGEDGAVVLWDPANGRVLRRFTDHGKWVLGLDISADGHTVCSAARAIICWDADNGKRLWAQAANGGDILWLGFAADGRTLISAGRDGSITLWTVGNNTPRQIVPSPKGTTGTTPDAVAISPDGGLVVAAGMEGVTVWDTRTAQQARGSFLLPIPDAKALEAGTGGWSNGAAFSPDGRRLAIAFERPLKNGHYDGSWIHIFDLATWRSHVLDSPLVLHAIAFSPDGRSIAGAGGKAMIWDAATGRVVLETPDIDANGEIAFSPDGRYLAVPSEKGLLATWEIATGQMRQSFTGKTDPVEAAALRRDDRWLVLSDYNSLHFWDLQSGQAARRLPLPPRGDELAKNPTQTGAFPRRSMYLGGGKALLWLDELKAHFLAAESGQEEGTVGRALFLKKGMTFEAVKQAMLNFGDATASADGKVVALRSALNDAVWIVDATTMQVRARFNAGPIGNLKGLALSPDGKLLAIESGGSNRTSERAIELHDAGTGALVRQWQTPGDKPISLAFRPDGLLLAAGGWEGDVSLWNPATGELIADLGRQGDQVRQLAFSADGRLLASGGFDGSIRVWDNGTRRLLHTLTQGEVTNLFFAKAGNMLFSTSSDGSTHCWDMGSGELLATLIAIHGSDDWLVFTPDGLFDGSPSAWNQMLWRFSDDLFDVAPVEWFFTDFYYPGLLADILGGRRPKAAQSVAQKDRRQPQLHITLADAKPDTMLTARRAMVKIDVSQAPGGAQDVRLFRNGSLVKLWAGDVLKEQSSVTLTATIPIVAGENRLTAYAFNHDNIKSSDATLVANGAESLKRTGLSYILAIGINSYSNPHYNLKYAVADAQGFSAEVKRQQEMLKNYARVEIISLSDSEATKANIMQKLAQLVERVQPGDIVIVYFAGHGTAQQNRFYLIPHDLGYDGPRATLDEAGLQSILAHSISDRELEKAFEKIDAGQILLVIDACNSGQALEAEEKRRGPMNSKGLAQLAYEKGMYILTAAQSYQAAQEASLLGHGYLTYALVVEGLKNGAADDEPKDGAVLLREWLDYASNRVREMQLQKMKQARGLGLEFSFVEGEERQLSLEQRNVQRPRVFYRRGLDTNPLIVARPRTAPPRE